MSMVEATNGRPAAPSEALAAVLLRTINEAAKVVSKESTAAGTPLTMSVLQEALDKVCGGSE
jgi:hypothetical protein